MQLEPPGSPAVLGRTFVLIGLLLLLVTLLGPVSRGFVPETQGSNTATFSAVCT